MAFRLERDLVGELKVPKDAYYGIHSLRAQENFPITGGRLPRAMIKALGLCKKACAIANQKVGVLDNTKAAAIIKACDEVIEGKLDEAFIVDPIQGGAGTSTNMNANEVIANRALHILGEDMGNPGIISPNDHINYGQSTNDVYPTCLKMALLMAFDPLLQEMDRLHDALMKKAAQFDKVMKMGRTQLQDAVPVRLGQEFAAYAAVIAREKTRLEKARQELLAVNLGGTAIGTGVNAHPEFIKMIVPTLAEISGMPVYQCQNLIDGTQNLDCYPAVSSALKGAGMSLSKICNDLRLMSSGPRTGLGEIILPARQNGSSIMPGKINPVIPEVVSQIAFRLLGFDVTVSMAAEAGQLELNAFEPVIFDTLYQGITQLTHGIATLIDHCILGIAANEENCQRHVDQAIGLVTALCPRIGYQAACSLAKQALHEKRPLKQVVKESGLIASNELDAALDPWPMTELSSNQG